MDCPKQWNSEAMNVSIRKADKIVPEYSLTGDLQSHRRCPRQYRLYNLAALPPSKPVQQWFGEFIHGVMEEACLRWRDDDDYRTFPWDWHTLILPIEMEIYARLQAKGLKAPPGLFRRYDRVNDGDPKTLRRLASYRAEAAISTWAPSLFPLVTSVEVRLKGSRRIPPDVPSAITRADRYSVTGVVDVLSAVDLRKSPDNPIVRKLLENSVVRTELEGTSDFDVIVDYKGMRRPIPPDSSQPDNRTWEEQAWQLQTYSWLRQQQAPDRRVIAGVLLYLNELVPARADIKELIRESGDGGHPILTDLPATKDDWDDATAYARAVAEASATQSVDDDLLDEYDLASDRPVMKLLRERSFRLVPIDQFTVKEGLANFDRTVADIEGCVHMEGQFGDIKSAWKPSFERRTCTACDFKYHCEATVSQKGFSNDPTVP